MWRRPHEGAPLAPPLRTRVTDAWRAFAHATPPPTPPRLGDLAWADPRRLFPAPHGITPYNPSELVQRQGLRLFHRMRRDEQVKAALAFKKWAVLGGGYELVAPEGQADTWAPKRFVEEVFDHLETTLPNALLDVLSALDYGVSVTEQIWARSETQALRGALVLHSLETRAPWSFAFYADAYGHLPPNGLRQDQMGQEVPLPQDKFVIYVHEGSFGNWYGTSDLESAYRAWWLKDNAYKWFAMLLERYGIPPILALFDPQKYPTTKPQEIVTMLERIQAATVGALPRPAGGDETLSLWAPERLAAQAKDVFLPGFDLLDRHIAKAILMPQLLGFTADAEEGSYARSQTHFDAFLLVNRRLQDDLRVRAVQRRLIQPLVDLNFGPQRAYPAFRFLPLTKEIKTELFETWRGLVESQIVRRQRTDEAHLRQALDMPEVDETQVVEPPAPAPAPDPTGRPGEPEAEGDGDGDGLDAADARRPGRPPMRRARQRYVAREPTRYERRVDFSQVGRTLDSLEASAHVALRESLLTARDTLVAKVERALPDLGLADLDDLLHLAGAPARRQALLAFVRAGFEAGGQALRREVRPATFQAGDAAFVPETALRWLKAKAFWITGVLDDGLTEDARLVLLNALKFGELPGETLRKLRDLFEPYVGDPSVLRDGLPISPSRLETILRTNATEAYNHGRLVEARADDLRGLIPAMSYSAVLDDRTTEMCRFLDGKLFRTEAEDLSRLTPPNHFNCRSVLVPVTLDMTIDEADFITPSQVGRALELAGDGFV